MKQTMQKIAIALCMALAFAACKNDDPETGGGVESITVEPTTLTLEIGKEATLQAKINDVVSTEVTWKSNNDAVATVVDGKVTAVGKGTAKITATAKADATKTATCTVTVEGANVVQPSGITVTPTSLNLKVGETGQITATIGNADALDTEHKKITWTSSDASVAAVDNNGKVTAVSAGEAKITAKTTNGIDATCTVTVTEAITVTPTPTNPPYAGSTPTPVEDTDHSGETISLTDPPLGYASLGNSYATGTGTKVTTKKELTDAIKNGGVIIIDGMIDMSDGYLPDSTKEFPNLTTLDAFVKKQNRGYDTYAAWVNAYALACTKATEDKSEDSSKNSSLYNTVWAFNKAYGNIIKLSVPSNTTLIGAGHGCGIKGGSIQITSAENVQIRNLTIKDAFDPFPHHEANDQYNAQWDGVVVEGSKNVWIDHCTFEDTLAVGHVYTDGTLDEKWQMYDGLCDIKNKTNGGDKTTNVTVSNCIFRNHDKTMLIGSGINDGKNTERFVTLQGNYFYNCGQRLPMVRNTTIHILNNYYDAGSNPVYKQNYAIGCRETSIIYAEANYFGSGIQYSFDNNQGTVHASGNNDSSAKKMNKTTIADKTLFSTAVKAYTYTPVTAEQAKTNATASAGAGYTLK